MTGGLIVVRERDVVARVISGQDPAAFYVEDDGERDICADDILDETLRVLFVAAVALRDLGIDITDERLVAVCHALGWAGNWQAEIERLRREAAPPPGAVIS